MILQAAGQMCWGSSPIPTSESSGSNSDEHTALPTSPESPEPPAPHGSSYPVLGHIRPELARWETPAPLTPGE